MSTKVGYEVEGKVVETLKELAKVLGVSKVTTKDVEKGGQYAEAVSIIDLEASDEAWESEKLKVDTPEEKHPMESDEDHDKIYTALEGEEDVKISKEEVMKSLPDFKEFKDLKDFIKDLDTGTLEYIAKGLELSWTPTYHANIHRMRVAMALHRHFFPERFQPKEPKKKARFSDLTTEQLLQIAKEHGLKVDTTDNDHINRMRVIMALKQEGQEPQLQE